jgi:hypothetical protein
MVPFRAAAQGLMRAAAKEAAIKAVAGLFLIVMIDFTLVRVRCGE